MINERTRKALCKLYYSGLSSRQVARKFNVNKDTVLYSLRKDGGKARDRSTAMGLRLQKPRLNISDEIQEVVDGLLLGDGNITSRSRFGGLLRFTNKSGEFVSLLESYLKKNNIKYRRTKVQGKYYTVETLSYRYFRKQYNRWYPNGGKKKVPSDVMLTPLSCQFWYMGDGNLDKSFYKPTGHITYTVRIFTCGFSKKCHLVLKSKLKKVGVMVDIVKKDQKYLMLRIHVKDVKSWFEYIGRCLVCEMDYKFETTNKHRIDIIEE